MNDSKIRILTGQLIVSLYFGICWIVNIFVMFDHCDFSNDTDWREEVIHLIGVISGLGSGVTVWL